MFGYSPFQPWTSTNLTPHRSLKGKDLSSGTVRSKERLSQCPVPRDSNVHPNAFFRGLSYNFSIWNECHRPVSFTFELSSFKLWYDTHMILTFPNLFFLYFDLFMQSGYVELFFDEILFRLIYSIFIFSSKWWTHVPRFRRCCFWWMVVDLNCFRRTHRAFASGLSKEEEERKNWICTIWSTTASSWQE